MAKAPTCDICDRARAQTVQLTIKVCESHLGLVSGVMQAIERWEATRTIITVQTTGAKGT